MTESNDSLSVALLSEIFMADQLARNRLSKALSKGDGVVAFLGAQPPGPVRR